MGFAVPNGGIDALAPKRRSDLGNTRVLTEDAIEEIYQIKKRCFQD